MTSYVRHAHSSGDTSKGPGAVADEVKTFTSDTDNDWNLLSFTEVGEPDRAAKLTAKGWASFTPDSKTDCAWMWLQAKWTKVFTEVHDLTGCTYKDVNKNVRHTRCTTVVLDHINGFRVLAMLAHLPSGVQDGCGFENKDQPDKVECWKKAVVGWDTYINKDGLRRKWDPDVVMMVADWNIDFHKECWRDYIAKQFPNYILNWKNEMPGDGSLGSRLIDATWASKGSTAKLLKDNPSSDHRPYGEKIAFD